MLNCDAIKIAYRQTKDGFAITFAVHPQDMPADLANADIGSQWQLQLVPLDDDGNPDTGQSGVPVRGAVSNRQGLDPLPAAQAAAPRSVSPDKRLVQQAAMACADPRFQTFLQENGWLDPDSLDRKADAAKLVRFQCSVKSRAEILPGTYAAAKWGELWNEYLAWRDTEYAV